MSDDIFFGPSSKRTYAALAPTDLETMGKIAANKYLNGEMSLNDAIVKIAREHPSISSHQIRRVVEFANQETFSRMFEKNANDKNIEFPVADPGHVLHALNDSARPGTTMVEPSEYSSKPVKLAHSAVEADLEIARMFGFDMASPHIEKLASPPDKIMAAAEESATGDPGAILSDSPAPLDARQMSSDEEAMKVSGPIDERFAGLQAAQQIPQPMPPQVEQQPGEQQAMPQEQASPSGDDNHHERMLELQREIEYAKKRQELTGIQQKMIQDMAPPTPPGMAPPDQAGQAGPPPGSQMAAAPDQGAPPAEAPPGGQGPEIEIPPPMAGAMASPPGSGMPKTSSAMLTKTAMAYAKAGRPRADIVLADLNQATSVDRIKAAAARKPDYPEANPYGNLLRLREKVAHMRNEAKVAVDTNISMTKEALDHFVHAVGQHILDEGSLGEVAHVLDCTPGDDHLKFVAVKEAMADLTKRGLDIATARAEAVQYQMTKGAAARVANPTHPVVSAYLNFQKVASAQPTLNRALEELDGYRQAIEVTFQQAALSC